MPEFSYRAQDASGKTVRGKREADDELELHLALKDEGLARSCPQPSPAAA
mgnify:CR=1 FL=1